MTASGPAARRRRAASIAAWLRRHEPEMLTMLATLVDTPSHASQPEGVAAVAAAVTGPLVALGYELEQIGQRDPGAELAWVTDILSPGVPYGELAGTFVARRLSRAPAVLIVGDLDTATPPDATGVPYRVEQGRAYGAGVADMKAGLVAGAYALRALAELGLPAPSIRLVLSGDEQAGSLGSRRVIEAEAAAVRWCLGLECARDGGRLMHSRAHIGVGIVEAWGREAHAGTAHRRGINAIEALARVIPGANALSDPDAGIFVTVTLVSGGRRRSVVPGYARATLDVRTPSVDAWDRTAARIRSLVAAETGGGAALSVRLYAHRPGFALGDASRTLLDTVREAGAALGIAIEAGASAAAGSTAFAGAAGVPTLDGMGPAGDDLMTPGEYVRVDSIVERSGLLAATLSALAEDGAAPA